MKVPDTHYYVRPEANRVVLTRKAAAAGPDKLSPHAAFQLGLALMNAAANWLPDDEELVEASVVAAAEEDRFVLWAHIVSAHANMIGFEGSTVARLLDFHRGDHNGPGGIRNHPESSRKYSLQRLGKVLSECEPDDA